MARNQEYRPGGFGQAQATSAWRGHGVDDDLGKFRSDGRLQELLCERLFDDPDIDASDVSVSVEGGRVVFEGTVDSRHTKNLIEDVADQFGIEDVQNNLRVIRVRRE